MPCCRAVFRRACRISLLEYSGNLRKWKHVFADGKCASESLGVKARQSGVAILPNTSAKLAYLSRKTHRITMLPHHCELRL